MKVLNILILISALFVAAPAQASVKEKAAKAANVVLIVPKALCEVVAFPCMLIAHGATQLKGMLHVGKEPEQVQK